MTWWYLAALGSRRHRKLDATGMTGRQNRRYRVGMKAASVSRFLGWSNKGMGSKAYSPRPHSSSAAFRRPRWASSNYCRRRRCCAWSSSCRYGTRRHATPVSLIAYRFAGSRQDADDVVVYLALARANRVSNAYDRILAGRFKGEGHWLSLANTFICALALTGGKELLEERRNVAVGERIGYDGYRLGDD